jgi:hypothetical protein
MMGLIKRNPYKPRRDRARMITRERGGREVHFETYAGDLWDRQGSLVHRNLDPHLAGLVSGCLAVDPVERPSIQGLSRLVRDAFVNKTADSYKGYRYEKNETRRGIKRIVKKLILEPN